MSAGPGPRNRRTTLPRCCCTAQSARVRAVRWPQATLRRGPRPQRRATTLPRRARPAVASCCGMRRVACARATAHGAGPTAITQHHSEQSRAPSARGAARRGVRVADRDDLAQQPRARTVAHYAASGARRRLHPPPPPAPRGRGESTQLLPACGRVRAQPPTDTRCRAASGALGVALRSIARAPSFARAPAPRARGRSTSIKVAARVRPRARAAAHRHSVSCGVGRARRRITQHRVHAVVCAGARPPRARCEGENMCGNSRVRGRDARRDRRLGLASPQRARGTRASAPDCRSSPNITFTPNLYTLSDGGARG